MTAAVQSRKILVIGGAGYIGSVLTQTLLAGGYQVCVLDALIYDNRRAIESLLPQPNFEFTQGDFCDAATVEKALEEVTDVILLAALVGDPVCKNDPEQARRVNDIGTIRLIDQLAERDLKRLVFMSTCSNYGLRDTDLEADEGAELKPQSLYAETKVKVERYLLEMAERTELASTILRCATAYGLSPRMRFDLTINEFTRELALGHELLVYDADTWRPYCHVTDIARAIESVLTAEPDQVAGQVFNVGSPGENYTKRMVAEILQNHLPAAKIRYQAGKVDPRNYRVDFSKIAERLGFKATVALSDFVAELIAVLGEGRFGDYDDKTRFYRNS